MKLSCHKGIARTQLAWKLSCAYETFGIFLNLLAVYGVMLLLGFCLFSVSLGLRLTELNPGGAVCLFVMVSLSAWHYPAEDCVHLVDEISWK